MSVEELLQGEGRRRTRFNFDLPTHDPWIVSVSHCSLSAEHPDPNGVQLQRLIEAIDMERRRTDRHDFPSSTGGNYAVFYSWCSLYEPLPADSACIDASDAVAGAGGEAPAAAHDALAAKVEASALAAENIELWFTHRACRLVVLDVPVGCSATAAPRAARGWPTFELGVHTLVRLGVHGPRAAAPIFAAPCKAHAPALRSSRAFAELLTPLRFAAEAERALLCRVYAATLERVLACAEHLHLAGLGWGDEECECLAEVLPACMFAKSLNLSRNLKITDKGIAAIAKALVKPGAAPRLREVNLQHIPYGAGAKVALREVARERDLVWYV